jgi:hypothetical protein
LLKRKTGALGRGGEGVPRISFNQKSFFFCELKPHAKFQNPTIAPSGRKVCGTEKQAGAELCQAQDKLGLAKPSLPSKKKSLAISFKTLISYSLYQTMRFSSIFQNIVVAFYFPKLILSSI